jgi:aminoglycoside 3-N-acetyltransferase
VSDSTNVTSAEIRNAIEEIGLAGQPVCMHSSLRSFGHVEGGADAIIDAFLDAGCTLMVPTFSEDLFSVAPEPDQIPKRNGWDYIEAEKLPRQTDVYTPSTELIGSDMGVVAKAVLQRRDRVRGDHPHDSFSAVGPLARQLIEQQAWNDVYGPLRELARINGYVLLAGVDLNRMTILHLAETLAGRRLFRRWATGPNGVAVAVPVGACSEGFPNLEPMLRSLAVEATVGQSRWRVYPAAETVTSAAAIIRVSPQITHCGDDDCLRCPDMVAGGPEL